MNVFDLSAKITLDDSEYKNGLDKSRGVLDKFGKTAAAALAAATAAAAALVKGAVDAYAQFEQLEGGVETLFGDSAQTVIANATEAYRTSGMSMNQYMETVTGFSASLLQSLGGDTAAAAATADMAIQDMSDNANKMGTNIESITTAYQGFAKQNYTMLDNLKLGYGGTKTEMERLITDAEALDSTFQATRDSNGDLTMSYADIVNAIHIVQTEMGITGTTAKEASTTIEGSLNSTKAAWENVLTALGGGGNLDTAIDQMVKSTTNLVENLVPVVSKALTGIGQLIQDVAPVISEQLPGLIKTLLPQLISAATSLLGGLIKALPGILQALWDSLVTLAQTAAPYLNKAWSVVKTTFANAIKSIKDYASQAFTNMKEKIGAILAKIKFPKLTLPKWGDIKPKLTELVNKIRERFKFNFKLPKLALPKWGDIKPHLTALVTKIRERFKFNFKLPKLELPTWGDIKDKLTDVVTRIKDRFSFDFHLPTLQLPTWDSIKSTLETIVSNVKSVFSFGLSLPSIQLPTWDSIKSSLDTIISNIKSLFNFDWSLPSIKLPHFSVSGGEWPYGLGGKGQLPSISVSWYKKAYDNPMLFTKPTVLQGFGDKPGGGGEMLYGRDNLMRDIKDAVMDVGGGMDVTINVYASDGMDIDALADKIQRKLVGVEKQRRAAFA